MNFPQVFQTIEQENSGVAFFMVGGAVRDMVAFGRVSNDRDFVVTGFRDYDHATEVMSRYGQVSVVGRHFAVMSFTAEGETFDVAMPRRDMVNGEGGHRGFNVETDGVTLEQDMSRRDFTVNSMAVSSAGVLFDPFNGQQDMANRVLRPTSAAFADDPLRVLRGMQFASRFGMTASPEFVAMAQSMVNRFAELPADRVRQEWVKWANSDTPSMGLRLLVQSGWHVHFPEVASMMGVMQDTQWHPEGDVFEHTCHAVDAAAHMHPAGDNRVRHVFAALCHDMGKVATTVMNEEGRFVAPNHAREGVVPATRFMERVGFVLNSPMTRFVVEATEHHMTRTTTTSGVRRMAARLSEMTMSDLFSVMVADVNARPFKGFVVVPPDVMVMMEMAARLNVSEQRETPFVTGRMMRDAGFPQGRMMGEALRFFFEAQMDERFTQDDAHSFMMENASRFFS